ncbi:acetyl-CoA carboxylase biotin carboxyl carrier protein [Terriglobus sp.]|uniref:acetyl-CoA carboxylase biotin carboxyl carrier protein n=1 Tax=Terriglobus sp. TaxID=1889013 RepID=UPI003B0010C7
MADMNMQELRELVEFLKQNGIAEFELDREEQHVHLKFESAFAQPAAAAVHYAMPTPAHLSGAPVPSATSSPVAIAATEATAPAATPAEDAAHIVKSPIVGTFYESSAPGSQPFIKVGDVVEVGQVLCIVEAMKLMNEIESDVAGEVVRIIAKNGSAVEYGQPLFAVKAR